MKNINFKNIISFNKVKRVISILLLSMFLTGCGTSSYGGASNDSDSVSYFATTANNSNSFKKIYIEALTGMDTKTLLLSEDYYKNQTGTIDKTTGILYTDYIKMIRSVLTKRGVSSDAKAITRYTEIEEKTNEKTLEALRKEKEQAIKKEDYVLAKELHEKIHKKIEAQEAKRKETIIRLKKEKEKALLEENYLLAKELHQKIKDEEEKENEEH